MNKRKSKGGATRDRPSPINSNTRTNASKTPDRDIRESTRPDGVYQNARFMHTVTSLIGSTLRVETQNGAEFEGIFHTFSPMFEMVLEWVHKVDPTTPDCISVDFVQEKMIFNIKDIVRFYAVDVDLEYASKESGIQTDAQISAAKPTINGEGPMRQLEEWVPDDDSVAHDLDAGGSNGWNVHDMFAKNQEFGVKTSFDPNLSGYTVQLEKDKKDTADWREKEKKAEKIAAEIERNEGSRTAADAENGDEEDHFSAVVRDGSRRGGSRDGGSRDGGSRDGGSRDGGSRESPGDDKAYVPPGRRPDVGRDERGRGGVRRGGGSQRTTPPPHERRYEHDRRDSHREHRDSHGDQHEYRGQHADRGHADRGHADNRGHGRYGDQRQGGERSYNRSDSRGGYNRGEERGYNRDYSREGGYTSETPPRHQPHQGRHQEQQHRDQRDHRDHRGGGNYSSPAGGPSPAAKPPQGAPMHGKEENIRKEDSKAVNAKVSPIPEVSVAEKNSQDRRKSGENSKSPGDPQHKVEHKVATDPHSATLPVDMNALPQRDNARSGRKVEKSRNEVATELKDFKDKFTLSTSENVGPAGGPSTTPTVSINPTANPPPKQPSPLPADLPKSSPGNSQKPSPKPSPKPGTPPQMGAPPPTTTQTAPSPNNSDKKLSTLNPNAKEFTLNPKAMEFTPRPSPQRPGIAPTPPRPQTPATPQGIAAGYPQGGFIITNAGQGQQNQQVFIPAHNNPQFMAAQQRPFRPKEFVPGGSPAGNHRQELPSPNMVTGPPILAQTPLQPPGPGYPAFPQPVQVQGAGGQVHYLPQGGQHPHHAFTRMVMPTMVGPGGIMPMSAMSVQGHTHTIDTISNASSLPSAFHQVPVSHGGSSQPPSLTQSNSMWGGVMNATPTGHLPGHAGAVPPQNQTTGPPPPHNNMGTPPTNPTPNPSPGPQAHTIMGYGGGMQPPGHGPQPNSLPPQQIPGQPGTTHYPMLVIPQGFHHGMIPTSAPPMGAPNTPGGHVMGQPGAPPTSMASMVGGPHFQYMQHQGTPNHIQMMGHHNQQ